MSPFDRKVRAEVYRQVVAGVPVVDARSIAESLECTRNAAASSLRSLQIDHKVGLVAGSDRVQIANPFSGVPTEYLAQVGDKTWFANCAWDGLAILALMGDGVTRRTDTGIEWIVSGGAVHPNGVVHLLVPARHFWDDVAFT